LAQDPKAVPELTPEQKAMMEAFQKMGEIRAEHKQLAWFNGKWTTQTTMWMDPSAPPEKSTGTAAFTPVWDGRYVHMTHEGSAMGQAFHGQGFMGFDNLKGKYFTSWMDSMSTGLWTALGTYDAATKTYTYVGRMEDPMQPTTIVPIRAVSRIVDDQHFAFEWHETRDGKETKTMQIDYAR
jgi:hypothetical protein